MRERVLLLRTADVPRCRAEDVIAWKVERNKMGSDVAAALYARREVEAINADLDPYFRVFVRPAREGQPIVLTGVCTVRRTPLELELRYDRCVGCEAITSFSFQWGLVHGEGLCGNCGWPYRLYHWPRPASAPDDPAFDGRLQKLLAYHPDEIRLEGEEEG